MPVPDRSDRPHLREFFALSAEDRRAWLGFLRTYAVVVRRLDAELEREHGLTLSSYDVLVQLVNAPDFGMRMSELADAVLISRAGMTRLIERLESAGLVQRQPGENDTRQVWAKITDLGLEKLASAAPRHLAAVEEHFLGSLSTAQKEALASAWDTILEPRRGTAAGGKHGRK